MKYKKFINIIISFITFIIFSTFFLFGTNNIICEENYNLIDGKCLLNNNLIQENKKNKTEVPKQLFDITFEIDESTISDIKELSGIITFVSFGSEITPVNYVFTLYNESQNEIYSYSGYIEVQTENVIITSFDEFNNLNLKPGKYSIVYTSTYNVDVQDKFIQTFSILKPKIFPNWSLYVIGIIILLLIITFKIINKNKKKK